MATVEQRVAFLEGHMQETTLAIGALRADVASVRSELASVRDEMNRRFEHVDARFHQMDSRFTWSIGLQFATLLAVVAALAGAYFR